MKKYKCHKCGVEADVFYCNGCWQKKEDEDYAICRRDNSFCHIKDNGRKYVKQKIEVEKELNELKELLKNIQDELESDENDYVTCRRIKSWMKIT